MGKDMKKRENNVMVHLKRRTTVRNAVIKSTELGYLDGHESYAIYIDTILQL